MRVARVVEVTAAAAVVSCLLAAIGPPAWATFPGANGRIAYTSKVYFRDGAGKPIDNPGDIHVVNPDGTGDTNLTPANPDAADGDAAWSPDGARLAFISRATPGSPSLIWVMNPDGSGKNQVTTGGSPAYHDVDPAWTADGQRIAFVRQPADGSCSTIYTVQPDGTDLTPLPPAPECRVNQPDFSPDGTKLAYLGSDDSLDTHGLYVADAGNNAPTKILADGSAPDWAPGGAWLAYSWTGLMRTTPDGLHRFTIDSFGSDPAWSPDGTLIASDGVSIRDDAGNFVRYVGECTTCGNPQLDPDWQPLPPLPPAPGYARPKAATPLDVSLVPAYQRCLGFGSGNLEHGPPFAYESCGPPQQESSFLTVGTADSNGAATQSLGRIRFAALPGSPSTVADEADVTVSASITDVRCTSAGVACEAGTLPDYTGSLQARFSSYAQYQHALVITDKYNGGTTRQSATGSFPAFAPLFTIPIPCAATASTTIGSACSVSTTLDAVLPGTVPEGKRSNWQLGAVQVEDGGDDGDPATDGNTIFAAQGIFVP